VAGRPLMGGMGIVYLCLDHGNDKRPVALKTFKPEYLPDRAARDRFLREGTTWVNLGAHPHIVRCHRVFQPGNAIEVYLVLELVANKWECLIDNK
jgi:serine/threonine protein kinase